MLIVCCKQLKQNFTRFHLIIQTKYFNPDFNTQHRSRRYLALGDIFNQNGRVVKYLV